jgi:hypothetical protein
MYLTFLLCVQLHCLYVNRLTGAILNVTYAHNIRDHVVLGVFEGGIGGSGIHTPPPSRYSSLPRLGARGGRGRGLYHGLRHAKPPRTKFPVIPITYLRYPLFIQQSQTLTPLKISQKSILIFLQL